MFKQRGKAERSKAEQDGVVQFMPRIFSLYFIPRGDNPYQMQSDWIGAAQKAFESVVTTEARLGVSAAVLLGGVVVAGLLAPRIIYRAVSVAQRRLADAEDGTMLSAVNGAMRLSFPTGLAIRGGQALIGVVMAIILLVVWGYISLAERVITTVAGVLPSVGRGVLTAGLLTAGVVGTRVLRKQLKSHTEASSVVNQHQQGVIYRGLQLTIFSGVGLAMLSVWGVNLGGLLVGAGFLGIVVGMAARQTLGAVIAGFVLMFSRPFSIGDWVVVGGKEGIVTDITIINTRLRSFDGEEIVMPNDSVSDSTITNRTKRGQLRIRTEVGIDYDADIDRAEEVAMEAIESVDAVAMGPKPQVIPTGFGDSAVILELRYWIRSPSARKRWLTTRAVVRAVKSRYDEAGINIPFPQREFSSREKEIRAHPGTEISTPTDPPAETPDTTQN